MRSIERVFIYLIRCDHERKALFIISVFKGGFCRLQNEHYFNKKTHCYHGPMTLRIRAKML